jgi:hypothetical protein
MRKGPFFVFVCPKVPIKLHWLVADNVNIDNIITLRSKSNDTANTKYNEQLRQAGHVQPSCKYRHHVYKPQKHLQAVYRKTPAKAAAKNIFHQTLSA